MATLQELERALVNAHNAGDMDAARKLAIVVKKAREDKTLLIPGAAEFTQVKGTSPEKPSRPIGERIKGAGEAALSVATGVVGTPVGAAKGFVTQAAKELASGQYGTREAANRIEAAAVEGAQGLTYQPRSEAGQEALQALGAVAEDIAPAIPVMPLTQVMQLGRAAQPVTQLAGTATRAGAQAARAAVPAAAQRVRQAAAPMVDAASFGRGTAGAAETPQAMVRRETAAQMPVPFSGESALTRGQASRDFEQLQFEKETAKRGDIGAPLRQRAEAQSQTLLQNFDALADMANPQVTDLREIGKGVDRALVNKANIAQRRIKAAYQKADEAGETRAPISMESLVSGLAEVERFEGVAPVARAIKNEAMRLGAVAVDESGAMSAGRLSLADAELLRQFVNEATDWTVRREAFVARKVIDSIDAATEGKGGENYRQARALRRAYAQEFENVGLTKRLLGTKRGTDERQVAFDDVFDRVILSSSLEEMNKLRRSLLTAGNDGKQAWADLKAKGIEHIKETALSASQRDSRGNPVVSPDKLARTIKALDRDGKLDSLYGKKQAQVLRDLAEIAGVIYTAPPGAINTSNTASALQVALDSVVTFGVTGIPAPAATALKEASKYVKNREVRRRINEALSQ